MRWLLLAIGSSVLAGLSAPRADVTRTRRAVDDALLFIPDGRSLRLVSSGQAEPLADLLWVRAVLTFGERYDRAEGQEWTRWLRSMVVSVSELDPGWRTPYFFGGDMLRVAGDIEGADSVYEAAMAAIPQDAWFPFSRGMNAYLYRQDPVEAARFMEIAARTPGAPAWYAGTVAVMRGKSGAGEVAERFLHEELAATEDPGIRAHLEWQLAKVQHNNLVERWAPACRAFRDSGGVLQRAEDLAELGFPLPPNPRGDAWVIGADGVVRSEESEGDRVRRVLIDEWVFVKR